MIEFAAFVSKLFSPDFGAVGFYSPECDSSHNISVLKADEDEYSSALDIFAQRMLVTHLSFAGLCLLLTVPAMTGHERAMHSVNARTAAYTLAVGSLIRSCVEVFDCREEEKCIAICDNDDDVYQQCRDECRKTGHVMMESMPGTECFRGSHTRLAVASAGLLVVYCLLAPIYLFAKVRSGARDGVWTHDEQATWGWLILKYKPARWWFEFPLLFSKMGFVTLALLLDSEHKAWTLLAASTGLTLALLVLVYCDKPFRDESGSLGLTWCDKQMIVSLMLQLVVYAAGAFSLHRTQTSKDLGDTENDAGSLFVTVVCFVVVIFQLGCLVYTIFRETRGGKDQSFSQQEKSESSSENQRATQNPVCN
eukprot:COSAG01_NODE_4625_length_4865_cov_7.434326_3_plen_365_part_00